MPARTAKGRDDSFYSCPSMLGGSVCNDATKLSVLAVEMDFFGGYLAKMIKKQMINEKDGHLAKASLLQVSIGKLDEKLKALTRLLVTGGHDEIKKEIRIAVQDRARAQKELNELLHVSEKLMLPKYALAEIVRVITGIQKVTNSDGSVDNQAVKAALKHLHFVGNDLQKTLKNQDTRHWLVGLLPSIIKRLVIDSKNQRYLVTLLDGTNSEWRDLT
jgi:hypothetical protein